MKTIHLHDLLAAIAAAVTATQSALRDQHRDNIESHFHAKDGGPAYPKTTAIVLPKSHVADGESHEGVSNVPHLSLANHDQVHLSDLELDLECIVEDVIHERSANPKVSLLIGSGIPKAARVGKLKLSFKVLEAPEGVSQMNDSLLKSF